MALRMYAESYAQRFTKTPWSRRTRSEKLAALQPGILPFLVQANVIIYSFTVTQTDTTLTHCLKFGGLNRKYRRCLSVGLHANRWLTGSSQTRQKTSNYRFSLPFILGDRFMLTSANKGIDWVLNPRPEQPGFSVGTMSWTIAEGTKAIS